MKKIYGSFILLLSFIGVTAQVPTYSNGSTAAGNNSFPFNTTSSRKIQWRILANSLNGTSGPVGPGNNITVVYFQCGSSASPTYPLLEVSLKQGPSQFAGGGNYETGMTTVYSGTNVSFTSVTGGWISFTLTTPFLYDPNLPLFVEVQQNATSLSGGPTVYQTSPAGPGFGRLYGNYPNSTYTGADQTVVNFGVDVIPNTPCTGTPSLTTLSPSNFTTCAGIPNPTINLTQPYLLGGLQYQWYASTSSSVGPFTAVTGATSYAIPVPTIGVTTWYQVAVTCTNAGGGTATLSPSQLYVAGSTTNTVPYYEDFEGVMMQGRLPNCSWWGTSLNGVTGTYLGANSGNRTPHSGNNYAAFSSSAGTNYYYSNGIWLEPGVTYSAGLWYQTDLAGSSNFNNLQILYGTVQSPSGLTPIASVNGAVISAFYKPLSNTFTVSAPGLYYIAVKATSSGSSGAPYLSWDDLSVTIPCTSVYNPVNLILTSSSGTACQGTPVTLNASGAHTYSWALGGTGSALIVNAQNSTIYYVTGTNTLTGCSATGGIPLNVVPAPNIVAVAYPPVSCQGQPVSLMANGGVNYSWNTSVSGAVITVTPNANTSYAVIGTGTNNCTSTASVQVTVKPKPTISANLSNQSICYGDPVTLTATGGITYQWMFSGSPLVLSGNNINDHPGTSGTYTVTGTDQNGCQNTAMVSVDVAACTSLADLRNGTLKVYPVPSAQSISIESPSPIRGIEIMDLSGRRVYARQSNESRTTVDISSLAPGVYQLRVETGAFIQTSKIVKE